MVWSKFFFLVRAGWDRFIGSLSWREAFVDILDAAWDAWGNT